jgi:predicted extracellular nuclease
MNRSISQLGGKFGVAPALSFWRILAAIAVACLAIPAAATSANVVISQVYGGGGNTGAPYKNDFVELFNRGVTPVSISGWSIQYASATGTTWQVTNLAGSIPAGGYYLVQLAAGTGGTAALPTPDATGTTPMSGTAGKVALVNVTTALTGSGCPFSTAVVDFAGFGSTANCFEGAAPTPAPSNTTSVSRALNGCTETDSNSTDFVAGAPNPRNSASPVNSCSSLPGLSINDVSVAEGNSGTTAMTFTVSLSAPAGAGGVTFDIATQDGTAQSPSDYAAKSLTAQVIPAGATTYTFTVLVNGDTAPEANETLSVVVSNVVGANIIDGTGVGTITNDDVAASLSINDVSANEGNSGTTVFTFTVSLSEPAGAGGVSFDIATADGTATAPSDYVAVPKTTLTIPAASSSVTFSVTVNGDTTGEANETFFANITNVTGAIPVKVQGTGTIINDDIYRIHSVQGSGTSSPFAGQVVTLEGIVTSDLQGAGKLSGFYIQEPDALADGDPVTSEGVFIYTNLVPYTVAVGDLVRVTGTVIEFGTAPNTLTEIVTPTISTLSSGNALPAVTDITLPISSVGALERYEGMLVRFAQTLTVSDHFDLAHFGEITLSANGRALQPTNVVDLNDDPPSGTSSSGTGNLAAVNAFASLNARSQIILDDASTVPYPPVIPFLDPATGTLRLGSTVDNLTGVLSQAFGTHRLYATTAPSFAYAPRPSTPPAVGGNVKLASMNVLNYFNGDGAGGGFPTSRGADSALEFNRQRAKTIAAIVGLDADVVGLLEMENDGIGANSAIQDLINGLNAATAAGTWAFIADPANYASVPGGTDAIRPIFIYKTAKVAPVGTAATISDSAFVIARAPVAQTFRLTSNNEQFTAIVNHFKAKSSGGTGLDADLGDGQAFFNNTRKLEAAALVGFVNSFVTAGSTRVIVMGDFNAYEQEDPIDVMRAGGLSTIINNSYSYMFNGLSGSLDHALGTPALISVVSGSGKWHINADEPVVLDYNVETKNTTGCVTNCTSPDLYAATPFRASDHDPVLVGLSLQASQTISFPPIASFDWNGGSAALSATSTSALPVTFSVFSGPCIVSGTTLTATAAGSCTISANQLGNADYAAAPEAQQTVTVTTAIIGTPQTITFDPLPNILVASLAFTVSASASSGLAVTFTSQTPAICTTGGTNGSRITPIGTVGTCTIRASQAGNATYAPAAPVDRSFSVNPTVSFVNVIVDLAGAGAGQIGLAGGTPLTCDATRCVAIYLPDRGLDLIALAGPGSYFAGWTGDGCSGIGTCSFAGYPDRRFTATFLPSPPLPTAKAADVNADGKSDINFVTDDGAIYVITMDGVTPSQPVEVFRPFSGFIFTHRADFNGDRKADYVFRGLAFGGVTMATMNGTAVQDVYSFVPFGPSFPVLTADFDGYGREGLVIDNAGGPTVIVKQVSGLYVQSTLLTAGSPWRVTHAGDFNGDGKADLVISQADGTTAILLMNGSNVQASGLLLGPGPWRVTQVADLDGDRKADVIIKHTDGSVAILKMNGTAVVEAAYLLLAGSPWTVTHTADIDGDGKSDIVIRNTDGSVVLLQMNGTVVTAANYLLLAGSTFTIAEVGDYNGDGKSDFLLKAADGSTTVVLMNGATVTAAGTVWGAGSLRVVP